MKKICLFLLTALLCVCAVAYADEPVRETRILLDTAVTIALYEPADASALEEVFSLIAREEALFSRTINTSDVSRINSSNGQPIVVAPETAELLEKATAYAELSGGVFDLTIGPLVRLWDIDAQVNAGTPVLPEKADIERLLPLVDYRKLILDGNTVTLPEGMALDLGGIAKGYIADRVGEMLRAGNVRSALINLGGNVLAVGGKPDGSDFLIGIRKPFAEDGAIIGAIRGKDLSVVTSGIYERYFEKDGTIYHHILDTKTGCPVCNDVAGVTIVSEHSVDGDALSTICLSLGTQDGLALVNATDGVECVFVMKDGTLLFSEGMDAYFVTNEEMGLG